MANMEVNSFITCLIASVIILLLYILFRDRYGLPGPRGLPIVGYLPFIRADVFKQLQEMSKQYGKIFQISMGPKPVIVLNDWESIKGALIQQREIFASRPSMFIFRIRAGNKDIPSQSPSPLWRHQRRFIVSTLRDMGMGKSTAQEVITEELEKLTSLLSSYSGKTIEIHRLFFVPTVNVILNIAAGVRFEYESSEGKQFASLLDKVFKFMEPSNILNFFPILRFVTNSCKQFLSDNDKSKDYMRKAISEHKSVFSKDNEPKDYIEAYLKAMYNTTDKTKKEDEIRSFSDERLLGDLYNFFNAGTETTSSSLEWAILYMSVWPTIQAKVQKEIDETIGKSKMPVYEDRQILPYTHAVILEVQRYASVVPLALAHSTKCATKLCGLNIPGNIEVWPNLWALHHDSDLWGDPHVFRPERFLGPNGKVVKPEHFLPFGAGARRCIGERLAKMELFTVFCAVMQRFTFQLPDGHPPPSLQPVTGLTLHPEQFSALVESRN